MGGKVSYPGLEVGLHDVEYVYNGIKEMLRPHCPSHAVHLVSNSVRACCFPGHTTAWSALSN